MPVKDNSQERKHPPFSLSWISIFKGHNKGLYPCNQNLGNPQTEAACNTCVCKPRCGFGVTRSLCHRGCRRGWCSGWVWSTGESGMLFPQVPALLVVQIEKAVGMQLGMGGCPNPAWMVLPKSLWAWEGRLTQHFAKCLLLFLAPDFQSVEQFQLQFLLAGCEARKSHAELGAVKAAASDQAQWGLTALPGSLLMLRLRILDSIPSPGKPATLVGANHSACSPPSPPCSSSAFSLPISLPLGWG